MVAAPMEAGSQYEVAMVMMPMEQYLLYQQMQAQAAYPEAKQMLQAQDGMFWMAPAPEVQPGANETWKWDMPADVSSEDAKSDECPSVAGKWCDETWTDNSSLAPQKLSTSAARRMRRKRATERAGNAATSSKAHLPEAAGRIGAEPCGLADLLKRSPDKALASLHGRVHAFSLDASGCRLIQSALEIASPQVAAELANELKGHVLELVTSPHGNYVIQKVITHLPVKASTFIVEEICGSGSKMARHRYACRIICRLIEYCSSLDITMRLLEEMLLDVSELCCHNFGHHVIQSVLEHGSDHHRRQVLAALSTDPLGFAKHRNSSYLLEKALSLCSCEELEGLLQLARPDVIADLALHQYGCFVGQALMEHPRTDKAAALRWIAEIAGQLEQTRYGQRFLVAVGLASESQYDFEYGSNHAGL